MQALTTLPICASSAAPGARHQGPFRHQASVRPGLLQRRSGLPKRQKVQLTSAVASASAAATAAGGLPQTYG